MNDLRHERRPGTPDSPKGLGGVSCGTFKQASAGTRLDGDGAAANQNAVQSTERQRKQRRRLASVKVPRHPDDPTEKLRKHWRTASTKYRRRTKVRHRVYGVAENEELVYRAFKKLYPDRKDLAEHKIQEVLLAAYIENCLLSVIDDWPNADDELKVDLGRFLRDFKPRSSEDVRIELNSRQSLNR